MTALPNPTMAMVLIVLLFAATVITRSSFPRVFTLVAIHNGIWIVVLAMIATNLVDYHQFGLAAWLTFALGLLSFNVGAWAVVGPRPAASDATRAQPDLRLVGARGLLLLGAAYAVGLAAYLVATQSLFGLETLLSDPESIRGAAEGPMAAMPAPLRLLLHLGPLVFALLAFPPATSVRLPILVRLPLLAAVAISLLVLLQRTNLFVAVVLTAVLWLSRLQSGTQEASLIQQRLLRRRVMLAAAAGGVVLLVAFQFVGDMLGKTEGATVRASGLSSALADSPFASLHGYLTAGTPAFLLLTESRNPNWPPIVERGMVWGDYNPQTWGAALAEPVLSVFPITEPWGPLAPFVDVGVSTNVYTWFEPSYRDFREPGVVLGALALGALTAWFFTRRMRSTRMYWTSGVLVSVVVFAPFAQKINDTLTLVIIAVVVLATSRWVRERRVARASVTVRRLSRRSSHVRR